MKQSQAQQLSFLKRIVTSKEGSAADKALKEGINLGIEMTIKVKGRLTRGEATTAAPTASLLSEAMIAELVRRLGVTRAAFEKHLRDIATESLVRGVPIANELVDDATEILVTMHEIKKNVIDQLPRQHRPGPIKVVTDLDITRCKIE